MLKEKNAHQPYSSKEATEEINFELCNFVENLISQVKELTLQSNQADWYYITIYNKKQLIRIPGFNPYLPLAKYDPLSVLVCFDARTTKNFEKLEEDYQIVAQNFIHKTEHSPFGMLWTGIYPNIERCRGYIENFSLPHHLLPLSFFTIANTEARVWQPAKRFGNIQRKKKKFIIF
ncbi:hypothetical protein [Desulfovibrio litoralis]|uniref:Nitroreductase family protein n=1 Tax=Desulfovibrio litoralis DSM 11393 TaxID=1121455 RepID=A0A1M7T6S8_9BACT|nr:hypothetical protein [Desulfovibrio litoralis]SHN66418.1 hypothetical protein SAMN02745728_01638 [Desulfovibrio litoralis DSM 11393]